jgi:nucleoside-diphosphate-sugar epimerase
MRVLIIGANGFIGSSLAKAILERTSWSVCGIDLDASRVRALADNPRFTFFAADISRDRDIVAEQVRASDVVLPLAAIANPMAYVTDPLRVFNIVFEENLRIIRLCAAAGVRVVFPSTSEVYGMCADSSFNEATSLPTFGPVAKERWIYATSKHLLERVIWAYGRDGLRFTIFRPFNWFGANLDNLHDGSDGGARVVTLFLGRMLRGEPVRLVDGGSQTRSFTYIEDGVDALLRIIRNEGGAADGEIFNIGNPANNCSIAEFARRLALVLAEFAGYESLPQRMRFEDVPAVDYYGPGYQDVPRRKPDIDHLRTRLGWQPRFSLEEGLRETIAAYLVGRRQTWSPAAAKIITGGGKAAWLR